MSADVIPGLFVAVFLPWLCGALCVRALLASTRRQNLFVLIGQGFFVGFFVCTIMMRLWDLAGLAASFWGIAFTLTLLGAFAAVRASRQTTTPVRQADTEKVRVPQWQYLLIALLLMAVAWRELTLLQELLLRPLYAWDAWMNWAPKAVTWFHQGRLVEFVEPQAWLRNPEAYTLGNRQASTYPITVPLIQLWTMLGIGTWDSSAVYLAWAMAPLALGCALYGHLRLAGVTPIYAVLAVYLLLSLPYLNVHTVLAGYADIWLTAAFGLAVFALAEYEQTRHRGYALLALILALLCTQLKNPGIVLGLIVLACGLRALLHLRPAREALLFAIAALLVILIFLVGVDIKLPYLGQLSFSGSELVVGRLGSFSFEYHDVFGSFAATFFTMINWHLLWYLLALFAVYCLLSGRMLHSPSSEVLVLLLGIVFIFGVFIFTKHHRAALNFVTVNRALLYLVPALLYCMFVRLPWAGQVKEKDGG